MSQNFHNVPVSTMTHHYLAVLIATAAFLQPTTHAYCTRGYFRSNTMAACEWCPEGQYSNSNSATSCEPCVHGKYGQYFGNPLRPATMCYSCPRGRYKEKTTYTRTTISSCKNCPFGYENYNTGSSACYQCKEGTYQDEQGYFITACKSCTTGKYNRERGASAASQCRHCEQGKYSEATSSSSCKNCDVGTYNTNVGSVEEQDCLLCQAGFASFVVAAKEKTACVACLPGQYQHVAGQSACLDCGAGKYSTLHGATTESSCLECGRGKEQPVARGDSCQSCGRGKFAKEEGTATCQGCPKGQFTNNLGSMSCNACQPGRNLMDTSGEAIYHMDADNCTQCPKRTYNPIDGLGTACFSCPASTTEGAITCDGCDPGQYKDAGSGGACVVCERGKHTDAMDLPTCRSCPSGWYATEQEPFVDCIRCGRGRYGTGDGAANFLLGCQDCIPGRYSAAESLASQVGQISCVGCPQGRWSSAAGVDKESRCVYCTPGKYNNQLAQRNAATACVSCVEGQYHEVVGAVSVAACKLCPAGFSQPFLASAYCVSCKAGRFSTQQGQSQCRDCERGKFRNVVQSSSSHDSSSSSFTSSQSICKFCPSGFSQNITGQAQCMPCLPGRTAGQQGSFECQDCGVGRFVGQAASVNKNCEIAPVGRYVADGSTATIEVPEGFRATSCIIESGSSSSSSGGSTIQQGCQDNEVCSAGRYGNVPPTGSCNECPIGFYSSLGWIRCRFCSPGTFSPTISASACQLCPLGYIQANEGADSCLQCSIGKSTSQAGSRSCEILSDETVAPPELLSLRPVDIKFSGLILSVSNTFPTTDVAFLTIQWSTTKEFRNTSGDMRQLIQPVNIMRTAAAATTEISFNASRPGPVWRSPLFLRWAWMLANGRNGRFTSTNAFSRIAADCREKQGVKHYLRTHPNDDICAPALDLLLKGNEGPPMCHKCPVGGSCNSPGTDDLVSE